MIHLINTSLSIKFCNIVTILICDYNMKAEWIRLYLLANNNYLHIVNTKIFHSNIVIERSFQHPVTNPDIRNILINMQEMATQCIT